MGKWNDPEADVDRLENAMTKVNKRVSDVEKDVEDIKRRRQDEGVSSMQTEEEKYQKRKKELKDGMFEFYKARHSKVFLSPLFEEKDTPFASFYIRPELSSIVSTPTRNDAKLPVKSLSEMFNTDNKQNREIYVLADAGIGKTAFSKYLAILWCQAHCPDEDMYKLFLKDDIDCMHEFDFLFLVLLRDSDDLCSIDDLIFEKIVSNLGLEEKFPENVLLKILKNEKCLVILDGLDEWTHPDKKCYRSPRSIPHRNDREKCTVLTTTRPWKLGVLHLNSYQLGKKVELTKLCYISAVTLAERILQRWKSYPNKDISKLEVNQFLQTTSKRQIDELVCVPLLLIYRTCLWCDGVQIGDSKCDLYINIVELLLSRTIKIHGELQQSHELSSSDIPECFAEYDNCTKYYPLLMHLGKLAYYTLFSETRENTLVFDGSVARKHLTLDETKFTFHSGMLSESTSYTTRKKFSKVSFSHKTVQEFFAAIFISSNSDAQKIVLEKCRNIQDILGMSMIYEFISKMNSYRMCEISNDLMSVINKDEETRDYRTRTGDEDTDNNSLYNIQKLFMCFQEIPASENIQLCLQDLFIDEYTVHSKQLQRFLKQNNTNMKSLYINTRRTSSSSHGIIDLLSIKDQSHIQKFYFDGDRQKEAEINLLLFSVNLKSLQYLNISNFTLSHKILEIFLNFVCGQKSMKELTLRVLYCIEHGRHDCNRLNLDLSKHSTLSKLDLDGLPGNLLNISTPSLVNVTLGSINLDESSLLLSRNMLSIERVVLDNIEMSAGSLQNFINVLENLPQSVTVGMYAIKPETEYDRVRENIRSSQAFHVIRDDFYLEFKTRKPNKE
ncbi:uncharacterized protein LOC132740592 [Ruditapes philippinarum]|uniref:uncharacterized protein LOC132740592 n=1 Tax=Ruditapes philippinarum TaxID=129788 RepID=UPI00295BF821|nr:uncharacterized protein LOC132740592 [Ruditapes philippinarum]XP_060584504.1 uncharacterized protein LOC132740592 [Ruditapes philippinarum]